MKKYIAALILMASTEIGLSLYLTIWRENFWQALSLKQSGDFLIQLGIFSGVALCICFIAGISGYVLNLTAIAWREKLTNKCKEVYPGEFK